MEAIEIQECQLDYLSQLFFTNDVLNKKGVTFIQFIEYWKRGKLEEILN